MAFKSKVVSLGVSNTTISQMGAGLEGAVHGLIICNNNAESRVLTLKLLDASESTTSTICVKTLNAGEQFPWPKPINLESGDALIGTGADLTVLHSTYVGTAAPVTTGFTGRGDWSSIAVYEVNDVVNFNGSSYLSNADNTGSQPPSANWTLLSAKGSDGIMDMIRKPTAVSPTTGGLNLPPNGPLVASTYAPVYGPETRLHRTFQVTTPGDTSFASPVVNVNSNTDSLTLSPVLGVTTSYIWRCRDVSSEGRNSSWMDTQAFTTLNLSVVTPTVTVTGSPSSVSQVPTISTGAYATTPTNSANHISTDWEVRKVSDNSLVWSSIGDTANLLQIVVPPGFLQVSTTYSFLARHNSSLYGASAWGSASGTTLGGFSDVLYDPAAAYSERFAQFGFNCTSAISTTKFVTARVENPVSSNDTNPNRRLYLAVGTDNGTAITVNSATEVLVADGYYTASISNIGYTEENACVSMLTATLGVVMWTTGVASNQCAVRARAFTLSGDTITLGAVTNIVTYSSTTSWVRNPMLTRMSDSSAVAAFGYQASANAVVYCKMIYVTGTDITVSTAVQTFGSTDSGLAYPLVVRQSNTQFITGYWGGSSNSYSFSTVIVDVSGTGASATFTVASAVTITDATSSVWPGTRLVMLTTTRGLVFGYRTALSSAAWYTFTVSGTTITVETAKTVSVTGNPSTSLYRNYQGALARLNDTQALWIGYGNVARVVTVGATITETVSQALTAEYQGSGNSTPLTALVAPGAAEGTTFIRSNIGPWVSFSRLSVSGSIVTCSAIFPWYNPAIESYTSHLRKHSDVLSSTRSVTLSTIYDAGYGNGTGGYALKLDLFNIAPDVPVRLQSFALSIPGTGGTYHALCALTPNRVLVFHHEAGVAKAKLVSVTDSGISVLSTVNFPVSSTSMLTCCRLSDTSAVVAYVSATTSIPNAAMLTLAGDVMTFGTPVAVSPTSYNSQTIDIAPFSASRALVVYTDSNTTQKATLINCAAGVVTAVSSNFAIGTVYGPSYFMTAKNIDSTRVLLTTTGSGATDAFIRVVVMTGDTLSQGSTASRSSLYSSGYGVCDAVPLSPSRGIVLQHTNAATIEVYSYTLGAGASTPSVSASPIAILDATDTSYSMSSLQCHTIAPPAVNKADSATALLFRRDGNNAGGTGDYQVRKFLRGTL